MKKFLKMLSVLLIAVVICGVALFAGCGEEAAYVTSIDYTSSDGNQDVYTITYSDGTTSTFAITNGEDGENGEKGADGADGTGVTVQDLYEYYQEIYGEITYSEFLSLYLSSDNTAADNSSVINGCLQSVMKVYTEFEYTYSSFGSGWGPNMGSSSSSGTAIAMAAGSAVIYEMGDEYTYIITNYHVVYDSSYGFTTSIHAYLYGSEGTYTANYSSSGYVTSVEYDGYAIECEYVGGSVVSDIAVVRAATSDIKAINANAKAVTLGSTYYVGETAIAIGNAEDEGISVTEGIISVVDEYITLNIDGTDRSYRSIRMDTAIYSGNSGGGLFNKYGQLIGITNAGDSTDQNINFSIPVSIVTGTADNIIYYAENGDTSGSAYTVTIGISVSSQNSKYTYSYDTGYGAITEDTVISSVTEGSIAETLGLTADSVINSVIINGTEHEITRYFQIGDLLLTVRAGDTIAFTVTAGGATTTTDTYTVASSDLTARA